MSSQEDERFSYYSLSGLLPEGDKLIIDRELLVVTHLRQGESGDCCIVEQQQMGTSELFAFVELLASYPYYSPLEQLLSVCTGRSPKKCREDLSLAQELGEIEKLLKPLRSVISRTRLKIYRFGLNAQSLPEVGYILMPDEGLGKHKSRNGL